MAADAVCPIPLERSLAALRMETEAIATVIDQMPGDALGGPTRLEDWTLQQLLAHLVRGIDRIPAYLGAPIPPAPDTDWLGYWSQAAESDPASVSKRAREFAETLNGRRVLDVWRETSRGGLEAAEAAGADRILHTPFGGMRLDHYATTRVFEVTVHGLDLRAALDLEQVATPFAVDVTTAVLDGLLDGPRPGDLTDPIAFILAATGRDDHPDPTLPVVT
jgi:uncharacterized protein (TIGR03083 family)